MSETLLHHKRLLGPELHGYMNVTLSIDGEKEKAYTLRNIIELRCPNLFLDVNIIKKKKEKKGDSGTMTIEFKNHATCGFNLVVLNQILEWCYTDTVDFGNLDLPAVMLLLKGALKLEAKRLIYLCELYIRSNLSLETVYLILKEATALELNGIKKLTTEFAHQNWPQFCASKPGMDIIGIDLFRELTISNQDFNKDKQMDTSPKALPVVISTVVKDFQEILAEARFADASFSFPELGDIKFHRAILAAHTKPLLQVISAVKEKNKKFTLHLEGIDQVATQDVLEYVYFGDVSFEPVGACLLIENAVTQYSLQHMLDDVIHSISHGITDNSSLEILRVTYLPHFQTEKMHELREKVLKHICTDFQSIAIPTVRKVQPTDIAYEMLADILEVVHQNYPMDGSGKKELKSSKSTKKKKARTPRGKEEKSRKKSVSSTE